MAHFYFRFTNDPSTCATLRRMSFDSLPDEFGEFADVAVDAIRRAYAANADRHDLEIGDDAVVFAIGVYRNSWFLLEQEVAVLEGWSSSRPSGSLVVVGAGRRVHVYRCGQNANVDLDQFRLDDERSSATKRLVASTNTNQMSLDLGEAATQSIPADVAQPGDLRELVVIHAGNPEEGCCGIWVGAPVTSDVVSTSPWAWIEPMWLPEGLTAAQVGLETSSRMMRRHDEMPEPEITLKPVLDDEVEKSEAR